VAAAQEVFDHLADDVAQARAADGAGNGQNAGDHPDHVGGHRADGLFDRQGLGVQQDQNADGGHDVHQAAQLRAEEEGDDDGEEDDGDADLILFGDGGGVLDVLDVGGVDLAGLGDELPGEEGVGQDDQAGDDGDLDDVQRLQHEGGVGDDALIEGVGHRGHGGAQADGELEVPHGHDREDGGDQAGGGHALRVVHRTDEQDHDRDAGGAAHQLGQDDDDDVQAEQEDKAVFLFGFSQQAADAGDGAGLAEGGGQGQHAGDQQGGRVGQARESLGGAHDAGDGQQCAAGHGDDAVGHLAYDEHNHHEQRDGQDDVHIHGLQIPPSFKIQSDGADPRSNRGHSWLSDGPMIAGRCGFHNRQFLPNAGGFLVAFR